MLSCFSLNEKSIELKTEPVNFSRGSGIVPHSKAMLVLHLRAFPILTSKQQTEQEFFQSSLSNQLLLTEVSDIILLPCHLSILHALFNEIREY